MNDEKFKSVLISLLKDDKDVQETIYQLINSENKRLSDDKSELQKQIDLNEKELNNLRNENIRLNYDKSEQQKQISLKEKELTDLRDDNNKLNKRYRCLDEMYEKFCSLDDEMIRSFQLIINTSSATSFLISGTDFEALNLYFKKVCMEYKKYNDEQMRILNDVFDYLFDEFNKLNVEYSRNDTIVDDEFDGCIHARTADSLPVGKITKVIMRGFSNEHTLVKSFVEVK